MKKKLLIPFKDGLPRWWQHDSSDEEKENYEFEAELELYTFSRGCSSALMILIPSGKYEEYREWKPNRLEYHIFLSDCPAVIRNMKGGKIKGVWTFVKKGQNYGITLVKIID